MICKNTLPGVKKVLQFIDAKVLRNADVAMLFANRIIDVLEGKAVLTIVGITNTLVDDNLRNMAVSAMKQAVDLLIIVDNCNSKDEPEERLKCFVESIRGLNPIVQKALVMKLTQLMVRIMDGRYDQHVYDTAVQAKFSINRLSA